MSLGLSIKKIEAACEAGSDAAFSRELDVSVKADVTQDPKP